MPKSFREVQDEYNSFLNELPENERGSTIDLATFAKKKDELDGLPEREAAYDPSILQKVGAGWERLTEKTGLPQAGELLGRSAGEALGASESITDVLGSVGRYTPEMLLSGWLTGGAGFVPRALNIGAKATGYGMAGLQGVNQTPSPELSKQLAGGAISAGTFGAANYLMPKVGNAAYRAVGEALQTPGKTFVRPPVDAPIWKSSWDLISANNPEVTKAVIQNSPKMAMAAKVGAEQATMLGTNEVARQAHMTVQGVPLMDTENRNPFTPENMVGQAAGLLPFTPLFIKSIREAPKLNVKAHSEILKWMQERQDYVDLATKIEDNLDKTTLQDGIDALTPKKSLESELFKTNLDILSTLRAQGKTAEYDSLLKQTVGLRTSSKDIQTVLDSIQVKGEQARLSPPMNQGELSKYAAELNRFRDDVNQYIRQLHTRAGDLKKFESVIEREKYSIIDVDGQPTLYRMGMPADRAKASEAVNEAFEGYKTLKTETSNARDPEVIEQLMESGEIPQITEESLKRDHNFAFDRSIGDPEFAWRAVVQKQANMVLDAVGPALKRRAETQKAENVLSDNQKLENELETRYINSLVTLPKHLLKLLAERGEEIQQALQTSGKSGEAFGKPQTHYPMWREAVIQAAETFNRETGTFTYRSPKYVWDEQGNRPVRVKNEKGEVEYKVQELPIETLYERDPKDPKKYIWYPKTSEKIPAGLDTHEVTFEAMRPEDYDPFASVNDVINEGGTMEPVSKGMKDVIKDESPTFMDDKLSQEESTYTTKFAEKGDRIKMAARNLAPEAIWRKVEDIFTSVTTTGRRIPDRTNAFRQENMKLAVEAMIESYPRTDETLGPKAQEFLRRIEANPTQRGETKSITGSSERAKFQNAITDFMGGSVRGKARMREVLDRLAEPEASDLIPVDFSAGDLETTRPVIGSKRTWLKDQKNLELFDTLVGNAKNVIDAFSGSSIFTAAARKLGFEGKLIQNELDPRVNGALKRIQSDPKAIDEVKTLVDKLLATKTREEFQNVVDMWPDRDLALFVGSQANFMGRSLEKSENLVPDFNKMSPLKSLPERLKQWKQQNTSLTGEDGFGLITKAGKDDLVIVDPPYIGTDTYRKNRQHDGFDEVKVALKRGAKVLYFNSYSKELVAKARELGLIVRKQVVGNTETLVAYSDVPRDVVYGQGLRVGDRTIYPPTPNPAPFDRALANVLKRKIETYFSEMGVMGDMKDMYVNIAMGLAARMKDVPAELFALKGVKVSGHADVNKTTNTGIVGLTLSKSRMYETAQAWIKDVIYATIHEVTHIDTFIREGRITASDAYKEQRLKHLTNLQRLAEMLTPEQKHAIIVTLSESIEAPGMRSGDRSDPTNKSLRYGAVDKPYNTPVDEFIAVINGLIETNLLHAAIAGTHGSVKTAWDVLNYMPDEITDYTRGTVRAIGDVIEAAQETLTSPAYRDAARRAAKTIGVEQGLEETIMTSPTMAKVFRTVVESARVGSRFSNADRVRAETKALIGTLAETGSVIEPPVAYGKEHFQEALKTFGSLDNLSSDRALPAINEAKDTYFKKLPTGDQGGWRKFYPFYNMLKSFAHRGVEIATDVEHIARGIRPSINRGISEIYKPFVVYDAAGRPKLDKSNPMIVKMNKEPHGAWREALNRVRAVQNEAGGKQMFVNENGTIRVMDDFRGDWDNISRRLSLEDQQIVQNWSVAMDSAHQIAADVMERGLMNSNVVTIAGVLMSQDPRLQYRQAMELGGKIISEYYTNKSSATAISMGEKTFDAINDWMGRIIPQFEETVSKLRARPGHSTESLPYDWIIRYKTSDDKLQFLSARTENAAIKLAERLRGEGNQILGEIVDRTKLGEYNDFDAPDTILNKYLEVEGAAWKQYLAKHAEKYGQESADALGQAYTPGAETSAEMQVRGFGKFLAKQTGKVDRQRYDYLEGFEKWVPRLVSSLQYKSTRQQLNLIMRDPRSRGYPDFQRVVRDQFDYIFSPTKEWAHEMTSLLGGYFLGGNLSSAMVEMTQSLVTLVPTLIRYNQSGGPMKAYKQLWKSIDDVVSFHKPENFVKVAKTVEGTDPTKWTEDQTTAWAFARAIKDNVVDHGVMQDIAYSRDIGTLQNSSFGTGRYTEPTPGKMALDISYIGMQHLMRVYSWAALFNNKTSFLAGIRQAYELGLRGNEAYKHAMSIKDLAQFGGGKANTPAFVGQWSNKNTQSYFTVGMTLQRYGFGMFATYAEAARDALMKNTGLKPGERMQAKKALGTMLATQTAIAGVFGLPFAAASLTVLEKVFGIEANKAVREGLAALGRSMSSEETEEGRTESGARLADLVLNGAGNQLFGIDLSSRAGVSNLFGTSAYRGFSIADLFGPAPSVAENLVKAAGLFGQGEPQMAARELVPQAFKNTIEMTDTYSKYGDVGFRDKSENLLYRPTTGQAVSYMFGFRPAELSAKRQAQKMLALSEDNAVKMRDNDFDNAAQALLKGNRQPAWKLAMERRAADRTMSPRDTLRQVMNRATDMQYEKDLIATGVTGNDDNRLSIAQAFGSRTMPQRSEMDYLKIKAQLAQFLGVPGLIDRNAPRKAMMIDRLVKNRQMTRSQATRLIEFTHRGQDASIGSLDDE